MLKVSDELLNDSVFNLENYISTEFALRIGAKEEEAFLVGNGEGKPTGIFNDTGGAELGVTAASTTAITADEIIDLVFSLKAPYRKNAVFNMNDATLERMKSNLSSVIGKDTKLPSRSTRELISALGVSPALVDRRGNHNVKVGFNEPRKDGVSNAKLANIIEYGKSGQPAKPFLKPARRTSRQPCMEAMIKKLEEEVESI